MQAVYELFTVAPYLPTRAKFTRAELDVYVQGYERALAQALRVMKPAAKRWETRLMRDHRPHLLNRPSTSPATDAAAEETREGRALIVFYAVFVFVVVIGLEVVVLLAALIHHLLR